MWWIVVFLVVVCVVVLVILAIRKLTGGKYAGAALDPREDDHVMQRWREVNLMAGTPHWAKMGESAMWESWINEQLSLWSHGAVGQDYGIWRQEKMSAGLWRYDDDSDG